MSIAELTDPSLEALFNKREPNAKRQRAAFVRRLEKAATQFSTSQTRGKRMWDSANGVVKLTLPISVEGRFVHYAKEDDFAQLVAALIKGANAGEYDEDLIAGADQEAEPKPEKKKRAGWSDERRAAFAAKRAAK